MIIPGGAKIPAAAAAGLNRVYQPQQSHSASQAPKEDMARRFDSVTISENGTGSYEMELKSRLSQEVRTVTSTDMISALREQVRNGTYQPDPAAIARKMLLMGEAV